MGQAAIAIARSVGAEIFATAGGDERRELLRSWGIKHVYDSRSTEFAAEIRRDTDGYGVDIVLNSVTGAAQRAPGVAGVRRTVRRDRKARHLWRHRLGLFPFRRNLSFYAVDLALLSVTNPDVNRGC